MNDYLSMLHEKKLTLIMSLPENNPEMCRAAFEAGADVVKCHVNLSHRASGNQFGTFSQSREVLWQMLGDRKGPMGIVPGADPDIVEKDMEEILKMPFSFVSVYGHHAPPALMESQIPVMAAADASYSLEEIRALELCGAGVIEASIVPGSEYGTRLTLRDLARYRAIADAVTVPVVVPTQRRILPGDVPVLARTGVRGIMIGAIVTGKEVQSVEETVRAFRRAIDALA